MGCRSVAFTYNDPVIFLEYLVDVAKLCREMGVKTIAVTAGYLCEEPREEFFRQIDAANIDLKAFSDRFYRELCGGSLQTVLDTLIYVKHKTDVWLEITNLIIPNANDSNEDIEELSGWIVESLGNEVPLHFSRFHPEWKMADRSPTPLSTLSRAREIALARGVRYAYVGNVRGTPGSNTYCHSCGELLIGRDPYNISAWGLSEDGRCRNCGTPCPGSFEEKPGRFGAKHIGVRPSGFIR
jgi:pyruvate formate lyase activating enzyme